MPIEKFLRRKSKKYLTQKNRLILPGMEFAYFSNAFNIAPRYALQGIHLKKIEKCIEEMQEYENRRNEYKGGEDEFWDGKRKKILSVFGRFFLTYFKIIADWCLAHFLKGVVIKFIAFPEKQVVVNPVESSISKEEGFKRCCQVNKTAYYFVSFGTI